MKRYVKKPMSPKVARHDSRAKTQRAIIPDFMGGGRGEMDRGYLKCVQSSDVNDSFVMPCILVVIVKRPNLLERTR
jgi:hypothetical protein